MGIVSNVELIISGVYLALGLMYLRFWWDERSRHDYLAFTISCLSYALFSWFELGMMHSQTPGEYLFFAWWAFLPGTVAILGTAWFIRINLGGRLWLFWTYFALRILALGLHLIMKNGVNFREVISVGQTTSFGETLGYPVAVPNPWMVLPHVSHLLLIIFSIDASVRLWRSGERRKALVFGTVFFLFGAAILVLAVGVLWGLVPLPMFGSVPILFIIAAMLYYLNYDMHRAAMLSEKLEERDSRLTETLDQLQLAAAAANVGMWTRKIGEEKMWFSEKAGEIWGFSSTDEYTREYFVQKMHPADREMFFTTLREVDGGKDEFQLEYRIRSKDGGIRWIHSRGKVDVVDGSRIIRGAIVDITNLKIAEEAVRELSHRLMKAQEEERARLARELHDDLSQSISLLSVQLTILRNEPRDLDYVQDQLDQSISDIERLSRDVRRISHELHPAILDQLGLEAALKNFCSDLAAAHSVRIDFEAEDLPRDLPLDISLCLYRVTQESLQNVMKHSAATSAKVRIVSVDGKVHLVVSDNGNGFDSAAAKIKDALGLINIDERVRAVKGKANIISAVGEGTRIEVHIPVDREG